MHKTVRNTLEGLNLGKAQVYRHLCVFPILSTGGDGPDYLTMEEAIEARVITVRGGGGGTDAAPQRQDPGV